MLPKIDASIRLYTPNTCAKFQPDRSMHTSVTAILQSVRNDEEERRKNFNEILISEMA